MNIKSPKLKNISIIFLGLFLFTLDRILKYLSISGFLNTLKNNFISLDYFANNNLAFSIPFNNGLSIIISVLILFIVNFYLILKNKKNVNSNILISLMFVNIGGVSNIIDRIKYGYVIDYINVLNINIFNLSDVFIILGFLICLLEIKWFQK